MSNYRHMDEYRCQTCGKLANEELCGDLCRSCKAPGAAEQAAREAAAEEQDDADSYVRGDGRDHLERYGREFSADELVETGVWR